MWGGPKGTLVATLIALPCSRYSHGDLCIAVGKTQLSWRKVPLGLSTAEG